MRREEMKSLIDLHKRLTVENLDPIIIHDFNECLMGWEVSEEEAKTIRGCTGGNVESRYQLDDYDFFTVDEPLLACTIVAFNSGTVYVCPINREAFIHHLNAIVCILKTDEAWRNTPNEDT